MNLRKTAQWVPVLLVLLCVGCSNVPTRFDLFVAKQDNQCHTFDIERDKAINDLLVLPGDVIVIHNTMNTDTVEIVVEGGLVNGQGTNFVIPVPPNTRRLLPPVLEPGDSQRVFEIKIVCPEFQGGGSQGPKVVVGDPP